MKQHLQGTTLVLGSSGKTGRRVAARLQRQTVQVRAGSRSGDPPFDWDDRNTWLPAIEHVQSAYVTYFPDLAFPGAASAVEAFAKMAAENGVRRLVLLSGRGEEGALAGELAVRDCGAEWTIIRASWFDQNFSEGHLLEPVLSGAVAFPAAQVREPFIDAGDIADVAVAALTGDRHSGQIYEVTGPRLLTFGEAIEEIGRAAGRAIRYIPISTEQYTAAMRDAGVPAEFAGPLIELIGTVLDGRNESVADGVDRSLGRAPRDFADYARDAAASGVWDNAR